MGRRPDSACWRSGPRPTRPERLRHEYHRCKPSHACRVGAPRRHLAGLAPPPRRLAGKFEPIPWVYAEIIRRSSATRAVELIVNDAASEKLARKILDKANALDENVHFHRWPTNRVWTRDSGCTFVVSSAASTGAELRSGKLRLRGPPKQGPGSFDARSPHAGRSGWRRSNGVSMPGRNTPIGSGMKKSEAGWPKLPAPRRFGRCLARARGARRRIDRCKRPRNLTDHRRMPARQSSAAQSGHEASRLRKDFRRASWHQERDLAGFGRSR